MMLLLVVIMMMVHTFNLKCCLYPQHLHLFLQLLSQLPQLHPWLQKLVRFLQVSVILLLL